MPKLNIITVGVTGVDMKSNPLFLPASKLHSATNIKFEEGVIETRNGFKFHDLKAQGRFQGSTVYSPARGLSHRPFSDPITALVFVVDSQISYNLLQCDSFSCNYQVCGNGFTAEEDANLYQAENYLIAQAPDSNTIWWEGYGCYIKSAGLNADEATVQELQCTIKETQKSLIMDHEDDKCCFHKIEYCKLEAEEMDEYPNSTHDTFIFDKHKNFLANSAGLGAYVHGRIHQQGEYDILVSDLIHKRGHKSTDDILLMEEQMNPSHGDSLSVSSKLGQLRALAPLAATNTANGEGDLIAYYDNGVVSFNTFQFPRETRATAEGETIQEGWSFKRMVSHVLNTVSAVGRYAVATLPRDHLFRSKFGLHLLRITAGNETFRDESINTISQDVQPILDTDSARELRGAAVGHWVEGSRMLATTGLHASYAHSSSPMGKGFVSFNQAVSYTEDRTPIPSWEGLWICNNEIEGIHSFHHLSEPTSHNKFGFLCSDRDTNIYFAEITDNLEKDWIGDTPYQVEWELETKQEAMRDLGKLKELTDARLELITSDKDAKVEVLIRTDRASEYKSWRKFDFSECADGSQVLKNATLGKPPVDYREASWYQLKVRGLGKVRIQQFELDYSSDNRQISRDTTCLKRGKHCDNYFEINDSPQSERWS